MARGVIVPTFDERRDRPTLRHGIMMPAPDLRPIAGGKPPLPPRPNPFGWLSWADLTAGALPPVPWAVPKLELGPGRPCGLWGYAGSGKTWVIQAIALAVASGEKLFGTIDVTRGKVKHISHELGKRALSERYRRLANGHLIDPAEVEGNLTVAPYPRIYLNSRGAEDAYLRELEGVTLCAIDSLRRAIPGADENDSSCSNFLDLLARASDKTGCTVVLLHHEGKSAVNPKGPANPDKRGTGRGSSAIEDASGCILRVEGSGKGPRCIRQTRAHDDGEGEVGELWIDLQARCIETPYYEASKPPVQIVLLDDAARQTRERTQRRSFNREIHARRCGEIVAAIEAGATTVRAVRRDVSDSRAHREALTELIEAGVVEQGGSRGVGSVLGLGAVTLEDYLTPAKEPAPPDGWEEDFDG